MTGFSWIPVEIFFLQISIFFKKKYFFFAILKNYLQYNSFSKASVTLYEVVAEVSSNNNSFSFANY